MPLRSLAALVALLLALPAAAQSPRQCFPDVRALVFGPSPFPDPYPASYHESVGATEGESLRPAVPTRTTARRTPARAAAPARARLERLLGDARPTDRADASALDPPCATSVVPEFWTGTWTPFDERTDAVYAEGRLVQIEQEAGQSGLRFRGTFRYTPAGQLAEQEFVALIDGETVPQQLETFEYDASGRLSSSTGATWADGGWVIEVKITLAYAGGPYATGALVEVFDEGEWRPELRIAVAYTPGGQIAMWTDEFWTGSAWLPVERQHYAYAAAGRLEVFWTEWDPDGSGLLPDRRDEFDYATEGHLVQRRFLYWQDGMWTLADRATFTHTGGRLTRAEYEWANDDEPMQPVYRERFAYSAAGLLSSVTTDLYLGPNVWAQASRRLLVHPSGRLASVTEQDFEGTTWSNRYRVRYAYVGTVAGEGGPAAARLGLGVAPNPAAARTTVALTLDAAGAVRVRLVDALGREVARLADGPLAAGPHALAVDTSRLAPGLYTVVVEADGATAQRRLTVVR